MAEHQVFPPTKPITSAVVNGSGRLILTYTDGSTVDAGAVVGPQGLRGVGISAILAAADSVPANTPNGIIARL